MYSEAKEIYARYGIDTEKVLAQLAKVPVSINCWADRYTSLVIKGGYDEEDA